MLEVRGRETVESVHRDTRLECMIYLDLRAWSNQWMSWRYHRELGTGTLHSLWNSQSHYSVRCA